MDKSRVSAGMLGRTTQKQSGSFSSNSSKEELWIAVEKCWKNFPMDALARGHVRHGQMASALIACNGGDDFVRERGGLHCNVCNCCATVCNESGKPTGVEVVSCFDDTNDDGGGGGDDNENHNKDTTRQQQKTLRFKKPDVDNQQLKENLARTTSDEIKLLFDEPPQSHPWCASVLDAFIAREHSPLSDEDVEAN